MLPACNSEAMQLHLDEIATKSAPAHALLPHQDGSARFEVLSNITLMPLPLRAPEPTVRKHGQQTQTGSHNTSSTRLATLDSGYAWNARVAQHRRQVTPKRTAAWVTGVRMA